MLQLIGSVADYSTCMACSSISIAPSSRFNEEVPKRAKSSAGFASFFCRHICTVHHYKTRVQCDEQLVMRASTKRNRPWARHEPTQTQHGRRWYLVQVARRGERLVEIGDGFNDQLWTELFFSHHLFFCRSSQGFFCRRGHRRRGHTDGYRRCFWRGSRGSRRCNGRHNWVGGALANETQHLQRRRS